MTPTDKPKHKGTALIIGIGPKLTSPESGHPEPDADEMGGPSDNDLDDQNCGNCYAYAPSTGRCQRFPPHGMEWSQVDPSEWCCEWKAGPQHDGSSMTNDHDADDMGQGQPQGMQPQQQPPTAPPQY